MKYTWILKMLVYFEVSSTVEWARENTLIRRPIFAKNEQRMNHGNFSNLDYEIV